MTRKISNWFHQNEGELFTVDETPYTREEIVQVVDDSVDPVQQVQVDGEKYVGVISFEEHDGWYEYTRWSDSAGEVNMGVCAKCVEEAEYVDEVSRTVGDSTDIARQKFDYHYEKDHEVRPDEVNTGATLLSGTTINGNTAIHPGMDGHGSGVDADFVLGNEALQTGNFYSFSETTAGEIISKTSSPGLSPFGVDIDKTTDCIWLGCDTSNGSVYEVDHNISVTNQFSSPSDTPQGIGIDNSDSCVWLAESLVVDSVYKLDQTGTVVSTVFGEAGVHDMGFDSNDCLWLAAGANIKQYDKNGSVISSFSPPNGPQGVDVDSSDSLWITNGAGGTIAETTQSGSIISEFSTPCNNSQGIGIDNSSSIWHANTREDAIYHMYKYNTLTF